MKLDEELAELASFLVNVVFEELLLTIMNSDSQQEEQIDGICRSGIRLINLALNELAN
ncbi:MULTISPECIES: hypothetical protein [Rhizobium]|uniref:Uncharacterized protein n=1 Tax=Rhizobium tumorigenes TaxID=2041385 RepID=A0AAF1KWC8_9HYPH|nr:MULTISPECIES: hypothetical protein [Rhizobium]MBO9101807.1 hypothetical protein [Rhizobium sp. L58/93]MBO9171978.1 hypothetical protein [Rhizobium sp. L245/93]MBO9187839.1 hypothetical protein [Rhizobium sp. E27B/91]QXZ87734.1 hypothetical protein J5287_27455 [Rhizobium sp. K1/93]QXZ93774.1 hypothetical protein J5280_27455 [Rhizobium sp. K15/93]